MYHEITNKSLKGCDFIKIIGVLTAFLGMIFLGYYVIEDDLPNHQPSALYDSSIRLDVYIDNGIKHGSAVIFDEDQDNYYLLTNHHVIDEAKSISAVDYYNNSYEASLIELSGQSIYDLAILKIQKKIELSVLEISTNYQINDSIRSIGFPNSIFGITYGEVLMKEVIDHEVSFPVIHHSAFIDHGSSGGALVDQNLKIIGINFAVKIENKTYIESYAIPAEKILEYLSIIGYEMR